MVLFHRDESDLTPRAAVLLDNVVEYYRNCGFLRLTSAGHTDRSGAADYNLRLSRRRAESVRSYLAARGVPESALIVEAYGESRPLADTAVKARESDNRRVEISFGHATR